MGPGSPLALLGGTGHLPAGRSKRWPARAAWHDAWTQARNAAACARHVGAPLELRPSHCACSALSASRELGNGRRLRRRRHRAGGRREVDRPQHDRRPVPAHHAGELHCTWNDGYNLGLDHRDHARPRRASGRSASPYPLLYKWYHDYYGSPVDISNCGRRRHQRAPHATFRRDQRHGLDRARSVSDRHARRHVQERLSDAGEAARARQGRPAASRSITRWTRVGPDRGRRLSARIAAAKTSSATTGRRSAASTLTSATSWAPGCRRSASRLQRLLRRRSRSRPRPASASSLSSRQRSLEWSTDWIAAAGRRVRSLRLGSVEPPDGRRREQQRGRLPALDGRVRHFDVAFWSMTCRKRTFPRASDARAAWLVLLFAGSGLRRPHARRRRGRVVASRGGARDGCDARGAHQRSVLGERGRPAVDRRALAVSARGLRGVTRSAGWLGSCWPSAAWSARARCCFRAVDAPGRAGRRSIFVVVLLAALFARATCCSYGR